MFKTAIPAIAILGVALWAQSRASLKTAAEPPTPGHTAFRYKIEASADAKSFSVVLDKSNNSVTRHTEFDEIPPVRCRYIRLTSIDWPRIGNAPLGVMEFTVFGK